MRRYLVQSDGRDPALRWRFLTPTIAFSWSRSFPLSCLLLAIAGFSMMLQMAATNTLVQAMSPNVLRGRVMAVYSMMFMGMAPFGALFSGAVAERLGAPQAKRQHGVFESAAQLR